jgi:4-amino-4-deoxy-L-arabinose transferase-like glycosyltransferase
MFKFPKTEKGSKERLSPLVAGGGKGAWLVPTGTDRLLVGILLGGAVFRLVVALSFPLTVSGDETYYWDWGRNLAWGYYSKPPLIAWLMALAEWVIGGERGIRLFAAFFASATAVALAGLARELFGSQAGVWTAVLTLLAPASSALGVILTIDAPLAAFWSGALWAGVYALRGETRGGRWAALGVYLIGLCGAHLTKQMGWLLPLLSCVAAGLLAPSRQRWLPLMVVAALSYACLIPTLWWNSQHDWILFGHTASHLGGSSVTWAKRLARFGEYLGAQAFFSSPVVLVMAVAAARRGWRGSAMGSAPTRYLLALSLPAWVIFTLLATQQRVLPNWPMVFHLPLLVLAGHFAALTLREGRQAWAVTATGTGVFLTLLMVASPAIIGTAGLNGTKVDPLVRLRGWREFAAEVETAQSGLPGAPFPVVVHGHRYFVSHLAFHARSLPAVVRWPPADGRIESQYEIWGWPTGWEDAPFLLLLPNASGDLPPDWTNRFPEARQVASGSVPVGGTRTLDFRLYLSRPVSEPENIVDPHVP